MTRTRAAGERGAALVELAVILPLLLIIAFGVVEYGSAWNRKLQIETAARSGARVGSSLGNTRLADYGLLQGVKSALNDIGLQNVLYVEVYKSTATDGSRPTGNCAADSPTSVTNQCNVYTGAQLQSLTQTDFSGTASCDSTAPDHYWCPLSRQSVQSLGPDYLGVWIKADYVTITGLFKSPFYLTAYAVMRLEPK